MEPIKKQKKPKEKIYLTVSDAAVKNKILELTNVPNDATNYSFWFKKENPEIWGLTIKAVPHGLSQYTWKYNWENLNGILEATNDSKLHVNSLNEESSRHITENYKEYNKKKLKKNN